MYQFRKPDDGHGITGAKNIYSSNVKIGNWNEDMIGEFLIYQHRDYNKDYLVTEQMKSYCSLDERINPFQTPPNALSNDFSIKNREGLPYRLIFNHGKDDLSSNSRYTTTSIESYGQGKSGQLSKTYALPEGSRQIEKYSQIKRDIDLSNIKTTESRCATAHAELSKGIITTRKISADLPNWKRRAYLNKFK